MKWVIYRTNHIIQNWVVISVKVSAQTLRNYSRNNAQQKGPCRVPPDSPSFRRNASFSVFFLVTHLHIEEVVTPLFGLESVCNKPS